MGPPIYRQLISLLSQQGSKVTFLSGYGRWYPEGALTTSIPNHDPEIELTQR
jgi:hypothetical protein